MADQNKASHILNTSATLAGFCFFVITSMKALALKEKTFIDEMTAVTMSLFLSSTLLSFLSIGEKNRRSAAYERISEFIFVIGLFACFIIALLITFDIVQ